MALVHQASALLFIRSTFARA